MADPHIHVTTPSYELHYVFDVVVSSLLKSQGSKPGQCFASTTPVQLYHKIGHGTLDMFVLNPSKDSPESKEMIKQLSTGADKFGTKYVAMSPGTSPGNSVGECISPSLPSMAWIMIFWYTFCGSCIGSLLRLMPLTLLPSSTGEVFHWMSCAP